MKIQDKLVLRKVGETWAVFPIAGALKDYHNIMKLNETGAFLWQKLAQGAAKQELVAYLLEEYEVTEEIAVKTVSRFIQTLQENKIV